MDVVAEVVMWLLYAVLTGGMDLQATDGAHALLFGAFSGLGAQLYRDGAIYLGLADKRRLRRLLRRRSVGCFSQSGIQSVSQSVSQPVSQSGRQAVGRSLLE